VQEYLDLVLTSARRQVVIEATIAEVSLSDNYQQGINWQSLRTLAPDRLAQPVSPPRKIRPEFRCRIPLPLLRGRSRQSADLPRALSLSCSTTWLPGLGFPRRSACWKPSARSKVLSSPKISVLNNQTAMLKVVDNVVYFLIKNDSTTTTTGTTNNFTSTPQSVSVGLVMSVTPQISENGSILLNVRPTISSLKGAGKTDPTPGLAVANVVPEIQTREMESMLRLSDGEVAVMGGLMEDRINYSTSEIPGLGGLPGIGNFFRNRNDTSTKTELVIFLKPTIIRDPSINGDYRGFRDQLPSREFFGSKSDMQGTDRQ
jgi:type II secretory pathway component GspD/PulD (secretin)